jgi:hypothetical protein
LAAVAALDEPQDQQRIDWEKANTKFTRDDNEYE